MSADQFSRHEKIARELYQISERRIRKEEINTICDLCLHIAGFCKNYEELNMALAEYGGQYTKPESTKEFISPLVRNWPHVLRAVSDLTRLNQKLIPTDDSSGGVLHRAKLKILEREAGAILVAMSLMKNVIVFAAHGKWEIELLEDMLLIKIYFEAIKIARTRVRAFTSFQSANKTLNWGSELFGKSSPFIQTVSQIPELSELRLTPPASVNWPALKQVALLLVFRWTTYSIPSNMSNNTVASPATERDSLKNTSHDKRIQIRISTNRRARMPRRSISKTNCHENARPVLGTSSLSESQTKIVKVGDNHKEQGPSRTAENPLLGSQRRNVVLQNERLQDDYHQQVSLSTIFENAVTPHSYIKDKVIEGPNVVKVIRGNGQRQTDFPVWETNIPSFREAEPIGLLSKSERLRLRHKLETILEGEEPSDIVGRRFKESVVDVIFPPGCKPSKHLTKTFGQFRITWLDIFKAEQSKILEFLERDPDFDQMCITLKYCTPEAEEIKGKKDIGDIWNDEIVEDSTIGRIFTQLSVHCEPPSYIDS